MDIKIQAEELNRLAGSEESGYTIGYEAGDTIIITGSEELEDGMDILDASVRRAGKPYHLVFENGQKYTESLCCL
ncbi:MAG: hypothetical protein IJG65_08200 [Synergistaceae bacterium]|nr:hypothetical protein [Synergistaceae bacterium]